MWARCPPSKNCTTTSLRRGKADPANKVDLSQKPDALYNSFLLETEMKSDQRMKDFLRSIGVQAPLTGCNYIDSEAQAFLREKYDYVDDHDYWDMPWWVGHQWSLPLKTHDADPVVDTAKMPRDMMPSRVFGKPFTVTEYSYVWPTADRAIGGVLMSTYASLQDWDGIYYFAYAGKPDSVLNVGRSGVLDLTPDPVNLLADRVGALIFRRGDVKPAPGGICFAVNRKHALMGPKGVWYPFPKPFSPLGLITRIGDSTADPSSILQSDVGSQTGLTAVVTDPSPDLSGHHVYGIDDTLQERLRQDSVLPKADGDAIVSETGQISLTAKTGTIKVITDKSECFSLPPKETVDGSIVSTQNQDVQGTLSVVAVDDQPLKSSKRILVLYLTNSANMGERLDPTDHQQVDDWGALPHAVRRGEADITFHLSDPDAWHAWAVDASGNHLGEVELAKVDGGFVLKANSVYKDVGCMAYELARN